MVIDGWDANFVLIACPNNAKVDPWKQELTRFCPWIKPLVVGNTPATRTAALDEAEARLSAGEPTALIVHYQALALIDKMGAKTVSGWRRFGQFDLLISDEAHLYKNRKAQFTRVARNIKTAGRLNLSGSVMSGRAEDLFVPWSMFQPKRYSSQWRDWNDRFLESVEDDYGVRQIVGPKIHRLAEFRAELGEVLTVRLAKDWLDIPEPHVVTRLTPMHPEQRKAYRSMVDELLAEMPDGTINYTTDGAPLRSACRQITAGIPVEADNGLISSKHDAAMADIESAGDSQCVYFAWHKRPVYELARRCEEAGIPCTVICGDVSQAERERRIDLFKRGGYRVLVATIATLSSAANLQCASVVGMLEESDDPVDNEQAIGRVVRQGQPVHASVYHYRVPDSVDTLSVQTNAASKAELRRLLLGTT
jgi:SNF2 family DNA or RNA helicase